MRANHQFLLISPTIITNNHILHNKCTFGTFGNENRLFMKWAYLEHPFNPLWAYLIKYLTFHFFSTFLTDIKAVYCILEMSKLRFRCA